MATPYKTILDMFLHMVEEDRDFFQYFNLSDAEAMDLVNRRSVACMNEGVQRFILECGPSIDLDNRDEALAQFEEDLTGRETYLLASLTYEAYLNRSLAKLKSMDRNFTPTDLRVFSHNEDRNAMLKILQDVHAKNDALMEQYRSRDRLTGQFVSVDFEDV